MSYRILTVGAYSSTIVKEARKELSRMGGRRIPFTVDQITSAVFQAKLEVLDLKGEGYTNEGLIDGSFEPQEQSYAFGTVYSVPAEVASDIYYDSKPSAITHLCATYFTDVDALIISESDFYSEVFTLWRNSLPKLRVCILVRKDDTFEVA